MPTALPNDISINGLNFNRASEGRALRAYQDSVGVWTIGYGLTNYDKGLPWTIRKGLTITEDQAEWYHYKALRENYLPDVKRTLNGGTYAHPQGVLDGGTSFHYNTGGIAKASWPGALKRGDDNAAHESLMSWNKAGGRVLTGLTRRRAAEWLIISAEDYGHPSGPGVIEPDADTSRERQIGVGNLLTAYPVDPSDTSAGNVKVDGPTAPTTEAPGVLKLGMKGQAISDVQDLLTEAGYPVAASAVFDQATYDAVFAFQSAHPNLTADGKVGPATRETLKRTIAMRNVAGKVVKTAAPSIPAAYIAFHQFVSAHAGDIALGVGAGAFVAVAGWYLWRHRQDAQGWLNGLRGRKVP